MTLKVYAHALEASDRALAKTMSNLLEGPGAGR